MFIVVAIVRDIGVIIGVVLIIFIIDIVRLLFVAIIIVVFNRIQYIYIYIYEYIIGLVISSPIYTINCSCCGSYN